MREIIADAELRRDMAALLRHALEKNHKLDPCQCSPCEKIAELAGADIIERACGQDATALQNLLAVIHHDGGHYVAKHGLQQASQDAEASIFRERTAADQASRLLRQVSGHVAGEIGERIEAHLNRFCKCGHEHEAHSDYEGGQSWI